MAMLNFSGFTGWSVPLLFAHPGGRLSRAEAQLCEHIRQHTFKNTQIDAKVIKHFFMLNSLEHVLYSAHKCLNSNLFWGILTIISWIYTTSESSKAIQTFL